MRYKRQSSLSGSDKLDCSFFVFTNNYKFNNEFYNIATGFVQIVWD